MWMHQFLVGFADLIPSKIISLTSRLGCIAHFLVCEVRYSDIFLA